MSARELSRGSAGFLGGSVGLAVADPHFSASLERGLAILECFAGSEWLGIVDVAERLGRRRSTSHRYMITLQALGFVEQGCRRRYRLTLGVKRLGCSAMSGMGLVVQARLSMEELARQTGFVVDLGVLDGSEVLLVERVESRRRGVVAGGWASRSEPRLPVYCTALGKLLLAALPAGTRRELFDELVLERCAPNTIGSKRVLRKELSQVSESGLAVCDEELEPGLGMIGAAVHDGTGEVCAALGLSAMRSRISAESLASGLGPHLQSAADQISTRLGYRRPDERGRAA
jgi:IclR family transcriptional regulator, pca regulon regulatory protein